MRALSAQGGTWTEILARANPEGDPRLSEKLNQLRGPHQFVPHVALNVLMHGCELALARDPGARPVDAIDAALQSAGVVVRAGD
jgi:hypothetical protein